MFFSPLPVLQYNVTRSRLVASGIPMFVEWLNGVTAHFRGTRNTRVLESTPVHLTYLYIMYECVCVCVCVYYTDFHAIFAHREPPQTLCTANYYTAVLFRISKRINGLNRFAMTNRKTNPLVGTRDNGPSAGVTKDGKC